ncbi:MAG: translation elongation factor Ts [Bacteroidota bacterium]
MSEVKISAKDVAELRKLTGAGMMDCKKALVEANGDMEAAQDILRKKGQKLSAKRADRDANEGVVIAQTSADGSKGIVVHLSCETDFVAKNEDFIKLAQSFADLALDQFPADLDALKALSYDDELSVGEKVTEQVGVIGEKLELSNYQRLEAALVVPYIHAGYRRGVLVGFSKAGDFVEAGKGVAMQVAAMSPVAVDKGDVDESVVQKEIEIGKEQARNEGKPEAILEKIAMGKLNKFFKENTLLNQEYVRGENKETVGAYLKGIDSELTVTAFHHVALGG